MGNFNTNKSDKKRSDDNRNFERPQMHQAICSKCGKSCLVPFKPTGNRPIFCTDCFKTEGNVNMRKSNEHTSFSPSDRRMYDAICDKCDNRCQIPFQPHPGRQVFCSHCFEQNEKEDKSAYDKPRNDEQFDALNAKLDKILQLLTTKTVSVSIPEKVAQKENNPSKELEVEKTKKSEKKKLSPKKKSKKE